MDNDIQTKILTLLQKNARASWQEISEQVYLTAPAVANRVRSLENDGIISGYTVVQRQQPKQFILVYMHSPDFSRFEEFLKEETIVLEAYKVHGDACFHITLTPRDTHDLELFLERLLPYGRYQTYVSMRCVKSPID